MQKEQEDNKIRSQVASRGLASVLSESCNAPCCAVLCVILSPGPPSSSSCPKSAHSSYSARAPPGSNCRGEHAHTQADSR